MSRTSQEYSEGRLEEKRKTKMHSDNRILKLAPIGGRPLNSAGILDMRLFKGENNLHAIWDPQSNLWSLRYDSGILPAALKVKFSGFNKLHSYLTSYLKSRNVCISEIVEHGN